MKVIRRGSSIIFDLRRSLKKSPRFDGVGEW